MSAQPGQRGSREVPMAPFWGWTTRGREFAPITTSAAMSEVPRKRVPAICGWPKRSCAEQSIGARGSLNRLLGGTRAWSSP